MNRYKFLYEKKGGERSEYDLLVTNRTPDRLYGIDLNKLEDNEKKEVKEIQKEYENKMAPFIKKSFRNFIKENIIENLEEEVL
jgi:2-oxo-4-hydroxy-4-carboxy--5-ureidoimidazoline (OHCU) decarboxylase